MNTVSRLIKLVGMRSLLVMFNYDLSQIREYFRIECNFAKGKDMSRYMKLFKQLIDERNNAMPVHKKLVLEVIYKVKEMESNK